MFTIRLDHEKPLYYIHLLIENQFFFSFKFQIDDTDILD